MNEINYQFNLNFCKVNASCIDLQKAKKSPKPVDTKI